MTAMDGLSPLDTEVLDAEDADRHLSMAITSVGRRASDPNSR
jgi:hypothetical protein